MAEEGNGPERSLRHQVGQGLRWSFIGQILNRFGIFGSGIVLARLLAPEDFGVYAVTLVALNILGAINELGVIPAIVRWQGDPEEAAGTGITLALGFSIFLYLLVFAFASPFAAALDAPEAAGVLRLIGLTLVVDGASSVSQAMLHRTFRQDQQTVSTTAGMMVYVVVAVVLAATGAGPWSIAWGRVAGSAVTGGMFIAFAPFRPKPSFDRVVAREILRFGAPLAASAQVSEAVLNIDYLVVGNVLGTATLGVYLLAFNLSSWPVSLVSTAIAQVSFAGFSRLVHDRMRLRAAFTRAFGLAAAGTLPLTVVVAVLGPEVIDFVYGPKWLPAVTPLRFLLVLGGLRVLMDLVFDLLAADGRSSANLRIRLVWLAVLAPALLIGADAEGLRGVGVGHMCAAALTMPILLLAGRRSGVEIKALGRHIVRPVVGALLAAGAMLALRPVTSGNLLRLVVLGGIGAVVYIVTVLPANPLLTLRQRPTQEPLVDPRSGS